MNCRSWILNPGGEKERKLTRSLNHFWSSDVPYIYLGGLVQSQELYSVHVTVMVKSVITDLTHSFLFLGPLTYIHVRLTNMEITLSVIS